jgi:formylglycine-generating enzyme required for sulfatase activity
VTRPSVSARVARRRPAAPAASPEELAQGAHDLSVLRADGPWVTVELVVGERAVARAHVLWLPPDVSQQPGPRLVLERTGAELVLVTPGEVRLAQLVLALDSRIEGGAADGGAIQVERPVLVARHEATWAEYRAYAAATGAPLPTTAPDDGRLPVTDVLVQEAEAYCRWAGGRLPSFPEWYRAARGATTHRFPWGDRPEPPPPGRRWSGEPLANFGGAEDGFEGLAPVGSFPEGASPFGCLDMVGNVMEFVQSPPRDGSAPQLNAGSAFTKVDLADRVLDRAFADPPDRRMPNTGFRLLVDVLPR